MFPISKDRANRRSPLARALQIVFASLMMLVSGPARGWQDGGQSTYDLLSIHPTGAAKSSESSADLRPCAFQQVTPGVSKLADVLQQLGVPSEESEVDGTRTLTYTVEPFEKVEILLNRESVTSIVLRLRASASPRQIAKELALENFDATPVVSEIGQLLGRAYPERGLLMNFASDSGDTKVSALVLETISAELFVLRVKNDARHRYQQNLADLEIALELDPSHVEALSHRARILCATGQFEQGLSSIDQALQLASDNADCALQRAELLAKLERHDEALTPIKRIVNDPSHRIGVRARG